MIEIQCDFCDKKMEDLGALLFSPPKNNMVVKFHICKKCYELLWEKM